MFFCISNQNPFTFQTSMRADPGQHKILLGGSQLGVDEADVQDKTFVEVGGGREGEGAGGEADDGGEGGAGKGEEEEAGAGGEAGVSDTREERFITATYQCEFLTVLFLIFILLMLFILRTTIYYCNLPV